MKYYRRFDKAHPMTKELFSLNNGIMRCILIRYTRDVEILDYTFKVDNERLKELLHDTEEISEEQFKNANTIIEKLRVILRYSYFNI